MQSWAVLIKMNDLPIFAALQDPCQNGKDPHLRPKIFVDSVDGGKKHKRRNESFKMVVT